LSLLSPVTHKDNPERCWYTRRKGVMRGPFTAENISSYILLGRIHLDDEVSQDRENWSIARRFASLLPAELASHSSWDDYEQLVIAHMKADERNNDRRLHDDNSYTRSHRERRTTPNRRGKGGDSLLSRYLFAGAMSPDSKRPDSRRLRVLLLMMLLASLMFAWLNPIQH